MGQLITISVGNKEVKVEKGTSLLQLSKQYKNEFKSPIVLAIVNAKLKELRTTIEESCTVEFLDITHRDGYRTYRRSLSFLLIKALRDIIGKDKLSKVMIHYAINRGYYCEIKSDVKLTQLHIDKIKARMDELVREDLPFKKVTVKIDKAREIFEQQQMYDKLELFKYRRASNVNLYHIDTLYDYYYGYMVPSTGCLINFELYPYDEGLILQFMDRHQPEIVSPFNPDKKLFETLKISSKWAEIMGVETVGAFNEAVSKGEVNKLILVSEALMEKRIGKIADKIIGDIKHKKFVFIAGPSSSGKTTFAHRLSIQLMAHGITTHTISVDNYFKNRVETPRDEEGNYDFECLEAIDVEKFNEDMKSLLGGMTVDIPVFNFITGEREYKGNFMSLDKNDIVVIEGIHGLNDKLSYSIANQNKFKIYISALTQLNIDQHNRIPTTDARLLRRIVRDNQYRGVSAQKTIGMWKSVRHGEEQHIFPFQEQADVMFNSALIYELAVLKQYAEPLLFSVQRDSIEYIEAKRLIKFLDYILGVSSERIPNNSILREFLGGSCFR